MEEWKDELVDLLVTYIKIKTVKGENNNRKALLFLSEIFERENIQYEIFINENNEGNLLAWIDGEDKTKKSVLFLNHIDVVDAEVEEWQFEPFGGYVDSEYIYGRGALDMKGLAIVQLMVMIIIKRKKIKLSQGIKFLAVCDEEIGGFYGAKFMVENYWHRLDPDIVIDEGGYGFEVGKGRKVFMLSYSQKKTLWLKFIAHGVAGHASQPKNDNPINILISSLGKIASCEKQRNTTLTKYFEKCFVKKSGDDDSLYKSFAGKTISITTLSAGKTINSVPQKAEASIDVRLMPDDDVEAFINEIKNKIADDRVEIEIIKRTDSVSKSNKKHCIADVANQVLKSKYDRVSLVSCVTPVGTDSKYFRDKGVDAFGFAPILIDYEEFQSIHGCDEKVKISELVSGTEIILEIILRYCK